MNPKTASLGRPIMVEGMAYAPTCEQGVVFLFGRLAPRLGFHIEQVQVRFPDCIATRRGRRYRIEFEFWASHFAEHRHDAKGADLIVCWENDWERPPSGYRHLDIIDLKKYVGARSRAFVVGCKDPEDAKVLERRKRVEWSVPRVAQVDDIVAIYRVGEAGKEIRDIWKVVGPFRIFKEGNREGRKPGLQTGLKLLARLRNPLTFAELNRDSTTRTLGVVKKRFIGTTDITDDWPTIYKKLVGRNPKAKRSLKGYIPD